MDIEKALVTKLGTVAALNGRIYPAEALKNAGAPFVFWLCNSDREEQALDGYTGLKSVSFEIHVVDSMYSNLRTVGSAVRAAVIAMQGQEFVESVSDTVKVRVSRVDIEQASADLHEREVGMFRRVYSAEINYQEVIINANSGQSPEPEGDDGEG